MGPAPGDSDNDAVFHLEPGPNTMRIPKGSTEWALNVGDETFYELLIELKE